MINAGEVHLTGRKERTSCTGTTRAILGDLKYRGRQGRARRSTRSGSSRRPSRGCCRRPSSAARCSRSSRSTPAPRIRTRRRSRSADRDQVRGEIVEHQPSTYYGTGRRKTSIARVHLRPARGEHHAERPDARRVLRRARAAEADRRSSRSRSPRRPTSSTSWPPSTAAGVAGQAGALRHGISRALLRVQRRAAQGAQEGRAPHPRRAHEGAQEVRTEGRAPPLPVQQALIAVQFEPR